MYRSGLVRQVLFFRGAHFVWVLGLLGSVAVTACTTSTAGQPSGVSSIAAPQAQQPVNNSQIAFGNQPVTLTVQNAVVTSGSATTYTFEVATDAGFANKVQSKAGIAPGGNGLTSVALDALPGGKDYYWHAQAVGGGTTGLFGTSYKFTIGPSVVINAPVPLGPLSGSQTSPRPTFRVTNATHQGPVGGINYRFDVANDAAFTSIAVTQTVSEGAGETDFTPPNNLATNHTFYWKATAIDTGSGVTSQGSPVQQFTTLPFSQAENVAAQLGVVLWPGTQPPGAVGHATMGDNWQVQTLHHIPTNTFFQSPTLEMLRIFDLLDRGFDPQGGINWMNGNGYPTDAYWYPPPEKAVIGFDFVYLALRNKDFSANIWDLVLKAE